MLKLDAVLERHPQLYFSDGDIVLAAKISSTATSDSPPRYQLYRVHRPVLRHNSTVFANLFADAAPGELYDDVPLVEMIGDTAEALAGLLAFIYDPSEVNVHRWDPDTPLTLSPTVRIANKYLVNRLHAYLVGKVKEDWPVTLEDWDRREAEIEAMRSAESISGVRPSSKPIAHSVPEPASAIRFAFEFGCPELLPAAFYQLSRTDVACDWDKPEPYPVHLQDLPARWSLLDGPDLLRHIRGGKKLARYAGSVASEETYTKILKHSCLPWWEDAEIPGQVRAEMAETEERRSEAYPCYAVLSTVFASVFREVSPGVGDPLKALKECVHYERIPEVSTAPRKSLCATCEWSLKQWVPKARQELWQRLREYFEVPLASP